MSSYRCQDCPFTRDRKEKQAASDAARHTLETGHVVLFTYESGELGR